MIRAMAASAAGGPVNTPEPFLLKPGEEIHPIAPDPLRTPGTRRYMADLASGRHPGVVSLMCHLSWAHLPEPLAMMVEPFAMAARMLLGAVTADGPELTMALRKLVEAKDCAVRARVDQLDV